MAWSSKSLAARVAHASRAIASSLVRSLHQLSLAKEWSNQGVKGAFNKLQGICSTTTGEVL